MNTHDIHPALLAAAGIAPEYVRFKPKNRYLALDQSLTHTGWAIASPDVKRVRWGTYTAPAIVSPAGKEEIQVVMHGIQTFLTGQFKDGVTHVFIETVYFDAKRDNLAMYAKLTTVRNFIHYLCSLEEQCQRCEEIAPKTWRKHFIGVTNSSELPPGETLKSRAMDVCSRIGWSVSNEHQAEACGILTYALCRDYPDFAPHWDPLLLGAL